MDKLMSSSGLPFAYRSVSSIVQTVTKARANGCTYKCWALDNHVRQSTTAEERVLIRTQSQDIHARAEAERVKAEAAKAKEERRERSKRDKAPTLETLIDTKRMKMLHCPTQME